MTQEAFAAVTFTAYHNTTTETHITFNENVNGTLNIADWRITLDGTSVRPFSDKITITDITNSTYSSTVAASAGNTNFINATTGPVILHHSAIPSNVTYNINFTNNEDASGVTYTGKGGDGLGFVSDHVRGTVGSNEVHMVTGYDATSVDWMVPTISSAEVLKKNPKQIKLTMSESVALINSTFTAFDLTTTSFGNYGVENRAHAVSSIQSVSNGTSFIYLNLQNPVKEGDVFTLGYSQSNNELGTSQGNSWLTDATNTPRYGYSNQLNEGHGNRLANATGVSVVNYVNMDGYGSLNECYDCSAPLVTKVEVSLESFSAKVSGSPIPVTSANPVHVNAGLDDTVSVMVTVADNVGAADIPFAGLYTNFGDTPDNLYYSNNFDSSKQKSTSYYEWNARGDDIAFDNDGAITWDEATTTVNADRTVTYTYTMTINDEIESTQVWVDIGDNSANYLKSALPLTLEVSGAPAITFASDDTQKVVSFFNESILLAIVSQWTSSDNASNVEQLSSVLGLNDTPLPSWTTSLATWVADDKIDVADMIVAVEYVINQ
jgi:hypothetical protein